jgi:hypothetical protein
LVGSIAAATTTFAAPRLGLVIDPSADRLYHGYMDNAIAHGIYKVSGRPLVGSIAVRPSCRMPLPRSAIRSTIGRLHCGFPQAVAFFEDVASSRPIIGQLHRGTSRRPTLPPLSRHLAEHWLAPLRPTV